tara:strand:+ start:35 stop:316 length:282 start_codon:yes stop_codon:yes gene_type:complete
MSMLINYLVSQMHGNQEAKEALQVYQVVMEVNGEIYLLRRLYEDCSGEANFARPAIQMLTSVAGEVNLVVQDQEDINEKEMILMVVEEVEVEY